MTGAQVIYLKLGAAGFAGMGIFVLSTFWIGGLYGWCVGFLSAIAVANVAFATRQFGRLNVRLRSLDGPDAVFAREVFFRRFAWLRSERKQTDPALEADARKVGTPPHGER